MFNIWKTNKLFESFYSLSSYFNGLEWKILQCYKNPLIVLCWKIRVLHSSNLNSLGQTAKKHVFCPGNQFYLDMDTQTLYCSLSNLKFNLIDSWTKISSFQCDILLAHHNTQNILLNIIIINSFFIKSVKMVNTSYYLWHMISKQFVFYFISLNVAAK